MASGAAHTAHAGADAAGLRFGGEGAAATGQRGGGEEHKVRIAQGRTAVQGIAEAVPDGKGAAPGDGGAAALPAGGNGSLYEKDAYGAYTICNIYYDTGDWRLIRKSLEKTVYKEKLRIRSYGVPTGDDKVFVELKKKYDGVVYKRRIAMIAARRFFKSGRLIFSNRSERRPHRYERELSCRQPPGDGDAAVPGAGTGAVGGKRRRRCFCDCTISA